MTNVTHLEMLAQGTAVWNRWRGEHPEVVPDLSGADLRRLSLDGADLQGANLRSAKLMGT